MSITPVDMQVIIPKSTEVGKNQQARDHQEVFQQQFGATEFRENANQKLRQVNKKDEAEGEKIKDDPEHGNKQGYSQNRHSKRKEHEDTDEVVMAVDTLRGRTIDIKM